MEVTHGIGAKLPPEIYEHIFSFLDGFTLLQTEKVCNEWREIVQWLGKKTLIWKRSCLYEMPRKIFLSMLQKTDCENKEKYEVIYRNWISWQHVSNYESVIVNSKTDLINNVTCAKISGNHIIYGTLQGAVGVQLHSYQLKEMYKPNNKSIVRDIYFMNPTEIHIENNYYQHSHLLVVYDYEFKLFILTPKLREITSLALRKSKISVSDNNICISDASGYIEIFEIDFSAVMPEDLLLPVTSFRLYRPVVVECINVFDRIVTVVTKSRIFKLDYNKDAPKWKVGAGQLLPFPAESTIDRYWTFYHEVVFANGYTELHVTTITNNKETAVISHTFNWMECLGARISEIYYYGNILFVTTHLGQVFIYVIKDWSTFNLMKYNFKINLKGSPILTLDIQEIKDEHRLLIAMNECISQVFLYLKPTF